MGVLSDIAALETPPTTLSEHQGKMLLAEYGIPVTHEVLTTDVTDAVEAAGTIGYPVVLKGSSANLTHKTEANVVRIDLRSKNDVVEAYREIQEAARGELDGILVQEMVPGQRLLAVGLVRDDQFGPCVMFGLGGIYTEILADAVFRIAPISRTEALTQMEEIRGAAILGPARGAAPADRETVADILVAMGSIGLEHENVSAVDVNPLILRDDGSPVAVDAAVWLAPD